jgi:peptidoglycan/LPS O-acetylase OafA/YrhL
MRASVVNVTSPERGRDISVHHFLWIDILRGFAAMAIVIYHARVDLWVGFWQIAAHPAAYSKFDRVVSYLSAPVPFFRSGVMLFFLISGFCIHYPYVNRGRELDLASYAVRRWFRIYPPYLIAVVLTVVVEQVRFHVALITPSTAAKTWATVFMLQNYMHNSAQMVGNSALWSLPVEVELYLLYPVFWLMIRRFGVRSAFLAVSSVSGAALLTILAYAPLRERYAGIGQVGNALMYWVVWCGGALLAERVRDRDYLFKRLGNGKILLTAGVSLTAALSTVMNWPIEFQELLWAGFWYLAIGAGLRNAHKIAGLPKEMRKALQYLGAISYSLYLVHYPFFKLCALLWLRRAGHLQGDFLISLAFCVLVVPVAMLFHFLFERPFHVLARRLARMPHRREQMKAGWASGTTPELEP